MKRVVTSPRPDWRSSVESLGFAFHTVDGSPYWVEDACYEFTAGEIDQIEDCSTELERLCLQAVDHVVSSRLYDRLSIPELAWPLIEASWRRQERNLYGRFDLAFDGANPPKLLEYNADTPTALLEASVVQWEWLQSTRPELDQFNGIHERLIECWREMELPARTVHFTCVPDHAEDRGTVDYLRDTAMQAGIDAEFLEIGTIGWDGKRFVDHLDRPIRTLFKLYPWEWLIADPFGAHLATSEMRIVEPAWKMILSNKALLVILWELFPGHRNLLPASFDRSDISGPCLRKPLLGREGANIALIDDDVALETPGPYAWQSVMYQARATLPCFDGRYPVIGSWIVGSQAVGMGIRDDDSPITRNSSQFVPHFFR